MTGSTVSIKVGGAVPANCTLEHVSVAEELGNHTHLDAVLQSDQGSMPPSVAQLVGAPMTCVALDAAGGEQRVLFEGLVAEASIEHGLHQAIEIHLRGATRSLLLDLVPAQNYFLEKSFSAVASHLVGQAGLELSLSGGGGPPLSYVQWGETAFDFLRRLADDHRCFMRPTPGGLEIRTGFAPAAGTLTWHEVGGLSRLRLHGKLAPRGAGGAVYDMKIMFSETPRSNATASLLPGELGNIVSALRGVSSELESWVPDRARCPRIDLFQMKLNRECERMDGTSGWATGESRSPLLRAGDTIRVEGQLLPASGEYGLVSVHHSWSPDAGYANQFQAVAWREFTNFERPEPRRVPGVFPARVIDNDDPRNIGRIRVQYDWMNPPETEWVRVMTQGAGAGRGTYWLPEKGDEVLIAFEEGDPERPFVIGTLWNGVHLPPRMGFWSEADVHENDVKRIVTKSGLRVAVVDTDGKEAVVVATPAGQKISMLDVCPETGMRPMISLSSPGDIYIDAPDGRVHIRARQFSREIGT